MRPFVQRRFWPLRVRKSDDLCRVNSRNERPDGDALRFSLHKVNCCLSPLSYWLLSPGFFLSLFIKMWFSAQCFPAVIDNRSWRKSSQRRNPLVKRAFSHLACRTGQLPGLLQSVYLFPSSIGLLSFEPSSSRVHPNRPGLADMSDCSWKLNCERFNKLWSSL